MNNTTNNTELARQAGQLITLREARRLMKPQGKLEPYRGYSATLPDGRIISHSPEGVLTLWASVEALSSRFTVEAGDSVRVKASAGAKYTGLRGTAGRKVGDYAWEIRLTDGGALTIGERELTVMEKGVAK